MLRQSVYKGWQIYGELNTFNENTFDIDYSREPIGRMLFCSEAEINAVIEQMKADPLYAQYHGFHADYETEDLD